MGRPGMARVRPPQVAQIPLHRLDLAFARFERGEAVHVRRTPFGDALVVGYELRLQPGARTADVVLETLHRVSQGAAAVRRADRGVEPTHVVAQPVELPRLPHPRLALGLGAACGNRAP